MTRDPEEAVAAGGGEGRREMERLAVEVLPALIARLGTSRLGELEVRGPGWRVRLRREVRPAVDGPVAGAPARPGGGHGQRQGTDRHVTRSPAVGYFSPGPALATGLAVRNGDLLGHVDVLGVRREVVAAVDGVVGRILVEPGQAVEYGQELVRVDAPASTPIGGEVQPGGEPSGSDEPAGAMSDSGQDGGRTRTDQTVRSETADRLLAGDRPAGAA